MTLVLAQGITFRTVFLILVKDLESNAFFGYVFRAAPPQAGGPRARYLVGAPSRQDPLRPFYTEDINFFRRIRQCLIASEGQAELAPPLAACRPFDFDIEIRPEGPGLLVQQSANNRDRPRPPARPRVIEPENFGGPLVCAVIGFACPAVCFDRIEIDTALVDGKSKHEHARRGRRFVHSVEKWLHRAGVGTFPRGR